MKFSRFLAVFLIAIFSFCFSGNMFGGNSKKNHLSRKEKKIWRKAENHYTFDEYDLALTLYSKLMQNHPDNSVLNYHAGICFFYSSTSKPMCVPYLEKAIQLYGNDTVADLYYHMAMAYLCINRFQDAEKYFLIFKQIEGKDFLSPLLERQLQNCKNGMLFWSKTAPVQITNLGPNINSIYADYAPVMTKDHSMMLFTSKREGSTGGQRNEEGAFYEDVYQAKNMNSNWNEAQRYDTSFMPGKFHNLKLLFGKAENVSEINTDRNDGSIVFAPGDLSLFIFRSDDIWQADWDGTKWQKPDKIDEVIDSYGSVEPSVFITADGKGLYFVSNRQGGRGEKDIYFCRKKSDDTWGTPELLGNEINTQWNEDAPYVSDDGNTLYFSSEGHNSMGGYDVFRSKKMANGKWSEAENLGAPINNGDDDVFYVPDEKNQRAWYATLNRSGEGSFDIFQINFFPEIQPLAKLVIHSTEKSSTEKITVHLKEILGKMDTVFSFSTHDSLIYAYHPNSNYLISVSGGGYQAFTDTIVFSSLSSTNFCLQQLYLSKTQEPNRVMELLELENHLFNVNFLLDSAKLLDFLNLPINSALVLENLSTVDSKDPLASVTKIRDAHYLNNSLTLTNLPIKPVFDSIPSATMGIIYFDFDQSNIRPDMLNVADQIATWMKANPEKTIEISGYADSKGSLDYNIRLSARRANAVKNYLIGKGIAKKQIIIKAVGESNPEAENEKSDGSDNPAGRAKNRRVEVHPFH